MPVVLEAGNASRVEILGSVRNTHVALCIFRRVEAPTHQLSRNSAAEWRSVRVCVYSTLQCSMHHQVGRGIGASHGRMADACPTRFEIASQQQSAVLSGCGVILNVNAFIRLSSTRPIISSLILIVEGGGKEGSLKRYTTRLGIATAYAPHSKIQRCNKARLHRATRATILLPQRATLHRSPFSVAAVCIGPFFCLPRSPATPRSQRNSLTAFAPCRPQKASARYGVRARRHCKLPGLHALCAQRLAIDTAPRLSHCITGRPADTMRQNNATLKRYRFVVGRVKIGTGQASKLELYNRNGGFKPESVLLTPPYRYCMFSQALKAS
jgi:hypothetical protein